MATNEFERGWEACKAAALEAMHAWQTDDDCSDTPEQRIRALTPPTGGGEGERYDVALSLAQDVVDTYRETENEPKSMRRAIGALEDELARLRQGEGK